MAAAPRSVRTPFTKTQAREAARPNVLETKTTRGTKTVRITSARGVMTLLPKQRLLAWGRRSRSVRASRVARRVHARGGSRVLNSPQVGRTPELSCEAPIRLASSASTPCWAARHFLHASPSANSAVARMASHTL
jgi:hypothetical protein